MITLSDGRQVSLGNIAFDTSTYHFTLIDTGEDVTNLISRADKNANWPDFDPTVDNTRASNEAAGGSGPVAPLDDSTASIFANQILTDPLAAPINSLKGELNSVVNDITGGSTVGKVALAAGVLLAVAVIVKLSFK